MNANDAPRRRDRRRPDRPRGRRASGRARHSRHASTRRGDGRRQHPRLGAMSASSPPGSRASIRPSRRLLEAHGWTLARAERAADRRDIYRPLSAAAAATPALAPHIETGAKVSRITRHGIDKVTSKGRETQPFDLRIDAERRQHAHRSRPRRHRRFRHLAEPKSARRHRPAGGGRGRHAAIGSPTAFPMCSARHRARYAGKRIAVVGAGYSAINVLLDLAQPRRGSAGTKVTLGGARHEPERDLWRRRCRPAAGARRARAASEGAGRQRSHRAWSPASRPMAVRRRRRRSPRRRHADGRA